MMDADDFHESEDRNVGGFAILLPRARPGHRSRRPRFAPRAVMLRMPSILG
jgi:hypothetical protein